MGIWQFLLACFYGVETLWIRVTNENSCLVLDWGSLAMLGFLVTSDIFEHDHSFSEYRILLVHLE